MATTKAEATATASWRSKTASELREIGDKSLILSPILVFEHEFHEFTRIMANPKPVNTLTRWKVLSNEEASELIDTGRMQRQVEVPMGAHSLTNKQIYDMQQGQPIFVICKGKYMMLAWQNEKIVAYEIEERKTEPPKSFAQKVREFFRVIHST